MPFEVKFTWSGSDLDRGQWTAVDCDGENMPLEKDWKAQAAEDIVGPSEQRAACITVNTHQVLQLKRSRFLYMDVGLWLSGHQTLGLVCGHEAALCSYVPGADTSQPRPRSGGRGGNHEPFLEEFLGFVSGLRLTRRMPIPDRYPADPTHLYVILPDMHVPQAPPLDVQTPPSPPLPYDLDEPTHSTRNPEYKVWQTQWESKYNLFTNASARDLFRSRLSIPAMTSFLDQARRFPSARQVTLIQLGDMYELWGGRDCYFQEYKMKPGDEDGVRLKGSSAAAEVGSWVGGTHLIFSEMFAKFDECEAVGMELRFLHGNHDSYTIRQEVVTAANSYISNYFSSGIAPGVPSDWIRNPVQSTVHTRMHPIIDDSIFIEHGQRVDSSNQDGATRGHNFTNKAVDHPVLKEFDCVRRPSFVTGAAAYWVAHNGDFGLYVMGHSHEPELEYVDVYHQREDIVEVWVPMRDRDVKHKVPKRTPLNTSK